jgi:methionyl-tRNA synthetase
MSKKIVFTSWPYMHTMAGIHNIMPILAADAVARFYRHLGHDVVFIAGSDEYGARAAFVAHKLNMHPQKLVDRNHHALSDLLVNWLRVSFTTFSRTTADFHQQFVRDFYKRLEKMGHIFPQPMTLFFCPHCDRFLPDRFVEGTCPRCNAKGTIGNQCKICGALLEPPSLKEPACAVCGSVPEIRESIHWFFDLPHFTAPLSKFLEEELESNDQVKEYVRDAFRDMQPFPITRDIEWGIPAPFEGAEDKTIYCWADSLLGDLSVVKNMGREEELWKDGAVESVFFMGRDNIPFYALLFPALLMAAEKGYNLPSHIIAHDFLTFEGNPCSKSNGHGIWLNEAKNLLGNPDYWRFYLLKNLPMHGDVDFQWDAFVNTLNDQLVSKLNVFVYRTLQYLERDFSSLVPQPGDLNATDREILQRGRATAEEVHSTFEQFEIQEGLDIVIRFINDSKRYLTSNESLKERLSTTLYTCVELCRMIAILLHPYVPYTAEKIWGLFEFGGTVQKQDWPSLGNVPHCWERMRIANPENLFQNNTVKDLRNEFKELRRENMIFLKFVGEYCETWLEN